jgi:hypothetical protein
MGHVVRGGDSQGGRLEFEFELWFRLRFDE